LVAAATESLTVEAPACDLILMGSRDLGPEIGVHSVVKVCAPRATLVSHNRSISGVSRIMHSLGRDDVHYLGAEPRSVTDAGADVLLASAADLWQQTVAVAPATIDDLDAFFGLQRHFQFMGANVIGMSPRAHDRNLTKFVHLPRVILIPLIRYLANSLHEGEHVAASNYEHLLQPLSDLTQEETENWARELSDSKEQLLPALERFKYYVSEVENEVSEDRMQDTVSLLTRQLAYLSADTEPEEALPEILAEPIMNTAPESLIQTVDSLLSAVDRIEASEVDHAPGQGIHTVRKLIEHTRAALERMYRTNTEMPAAQVAEEVRPKVVVAQSVRQEARQDTFPPNFAADSSALLTAEDPVSAEFPPMSSFADSMDEPTSFGDAAALAEPMPLWSDSALPDRPSTAGEPFGEVSLDVVPNHPETRHAEQVPPRPEPFNRSNEPQDLKVHDRPGLQIRQRITDLLVKAHIPVRKVEEFTAPDGRRMISLVIASPLHRESARSLLRQAGMQPE
jgi:hypothetical protein